MIHNIAQHPQYHHPTYRVPGLHPGGWVPISVFRNQKLRKLASEASFGTLYDGSGRDPQYRHPTPRVPGSLPGCSVPILVLIAKNHEKSLPRLSSERFMMERAGSTISPPNPQGPRLQPRVLHGDIGFNSPKSRKSALFCRLPIIRRSIHSR